MGTKGINMGSKLSDEAFKYAPFDLNLQDLYFYDDQDEVPGLYESDFGLENLGWTDNLPWADKRKRNEITWVYKPLQELHSYRDNRLNPSNQV